MLVDHAHYRTIWAEPGPSVSLRLIDQTALPRDFVILQIDNVSQLVDAIQHMQVRGAPALGAAGAFGVWLAARQAQHASDPLAELRCLCAQLSAARPTAVNLSWGVAQIQRQLESLDTGRWVESAYAAAQHLADQDVEACRKIGEFGLELFRKLCRARGPALQVMTHCNAGWLACVDYGTATAPIYLAQQAGLDLHVWVSETRPRNQGAILTAWELAQQGIAHTVVADNACGHLMQRGQVDLVIVGTDRTTIDGDVANKIGTYLKALSARAHDIPFYVAAPSSSIDFTMRDGLRNIPIEERSADELKFAPAPAELDSQQVALANLSSNVFNPAFDVTPADLVSALITERGVCAADEASIRGLFPERCA